MRLILQRDVDGASGDVYFMRLAGLSTETKPTENVATGSIFIEVDTDKQYVYDEDSETWSEKPSSSISPSAIVDAVDDWLDDHPEALAAARYLVTFTAYTDPETGETSRSVVTCDKTVAQITEAYNAGKNIVGLYVMPLQTHDSEVSMSVDMECAFLSVSMGPMSQQMPMFTGTVAVEGNTQVVIAPSVDGTSWASIFQIPMINTMDEDSTTYFDAISTNIRRVANPTDATDAANKRYVDNAVQVSVATPASGTTFTLNPYPVTYAFGEKAELTVTVTATSQYHFSFSSPSATATVLTMTGITGTMGDTVEAGKDYEVDIWNGIAFVKSVEVTPVT